MVWLGAGWDVAVSPPKQMYHNHKYSSDGIRLTDCCGAFSTYFDNILCCKKCWQEVSYGQGDGEETYQKNNVKEAIELGYRQIRQDLQDEELAVPVVLAGQEKETFILTDEYFIEFGDQEVPKVWEKEGYSIVVRPSQSNQIYYAYSIDFEDVKDAYEYETYQENNNATTE